MELERLLELAGVEQVTEMSVASEVGRKIQGKLSGKEHARRLGVVTLERIIKDLDPKFLRDAEFDGEKVPEELIAWLDKHIRREARDAVVALKKIEK